MISYCEALQNSNKIIKYPLMIWGLLDPNFIVFDITRRGDNLEGLELIVGLSVICIQSLLVGFA